MTRPRTGAESLALRRKRERTEQLRREMAGRRMPRLPKPTEPGYRGKDGA